MIKRFTLLILLLTVYLGNAFAQTGTISGKVTADNEPVIGATVQIKGTTLGVITDLDGQFRITNIPPGEVVVITRSVGYKETEQSVTLTAGETKTLDFTLENSALDLEEIVVTGLSVNLKEKELGTVRANVTSKTIDEVPAVTVEDALLGRMAGVETYSTDGAPGGGFRFRIRGGNSVFAASDPLVIIDGIFIDNANRNTTSGSANANTGTGASTFGMNNGSRGLLAINPEDIESVEVLKGAAAASLYGSRASNGVIIITTKKGSSGGPTFEYAVDAGWSEVHRGVLNYKRDWANQEIADWAALVNTGIPASPPFTGQVAPVARQYTAAEIAQWQQNSTTEWDKIPFVKGSFNRHSIRLSGGDSKLSYYASASLQNSDGHQRGTKFQANGARLSVTYRPNSKFEIRGNLDLSIDERAQPPAGTPGFIIPLRWMFGSNAMPFMRIEDVRKPINADGTEVGVPSPDIFARLRKETNSVRVISNFNAKYNILPDLVLEVNFGVDKSDINGKTIYPLGWTTNAFLFNTGRLDTDHEVITQSTLNVALNHAIKINENIVLKSAIGLQYDENTRAYDYSRIQVQNPLFLEGFLGSYSTFNAGSNFELLSEVNTLGIYINETLGINDKLFINLGGRLDRGSAFIEKFFFYPRATVSYTVSDNIRLRAAFGQSGLQPPPFLVNPNFIVDSGGYDNAPTLTPNVPGNDNLEPETQSEIEVGGDASFLNGRLNVELTFYRKFFNNMLFPGQLNPAIENGFTTGFINVGKMFNQGFEFNINGDIFKSKNLTWNLGVLGATLKNEVTGLDIGAAVAGAEPEVIDGSFLSIPRIRKGYAIGSFWGITSSDPANVSFLGQPFPELELSLNNQIDYKGVFFRMLWGGKFGFQKFNANARELADPQTRMHRDYWYLSSVDLVGATNTGGLLNDFSQWVQNADFFKLRMVTLGYVFPKKVLDSMFGNFVKKLSVSFTGSNLLTFTKYRGGYDVESETSGAGNNGGNWVRGVDSWDSGIPRSYTFSLNIGF